MRYNIHSFIRKLVPFIFILLAFSIVPDKTNESVAADNLPDAEPIPDLKVNGSDGPVSFNVDTPMSVTVSLDPRLEIGKNADWFAVLEVVIGPISRFFSLVEPKEVRFGIHPYWQFPLVPVLPTEVYNDFFVPGDYIFHFGVDNNADGKVDGTWADSVEVHVDLL